MRLVDVGQFTALKGHAMFAHADKPISPGNVSFQFFSRTCDGGKGEPIAYYEDDSNGTLYAFGEEFGVTMIVCADGATSAHEIYLDEYLPIDQADVHEAYGAYDELRKTLTSKGHEDTHHLRDFCNRYASTYFDVVSRNGGWFDLIEGYEYQSNSSGTGIVNVGHYQWMSLLTPAELDRLEIICELV